MRSNQLHDVIATDIPEPVERIPLEIDEDLTRQDAWMFGPLVAIVVALPLLASAVFGFSAWHLANRDAAVSSAPSTTFAARWPDQSLTTIR